MNGEYLIQMITIDAESGNKSQGMQLEFTNDNKRYSVEFYSKVIADLIDRKQYAKNRYWYKASYTDGLIN